MEAPPETTKAQMPIALARSAGSVKVVMMIESAAGAMIAPPTPCNARAATSIPWEPASPHKSEANVKRASPKAKTRLRPKRRSEEHTSELQSRQYLVCRLLLEKKTHI